MIVLDNVSKAYGPRTILEGISLQIDPGELVCVTGPSGAGKSTLIHLLAGAIPASSGTITIDGVQLHQVPPPVLQMFRRRVGVVFQDYKLLRNRTVAENIAFPLEVCGVPDPIILQRVNELLEQMHLTEQAHALPSTLSGGEQARTAVARAVAHKPLVVLADEPTGNLDPNQSQKILDLFRDIHAQGTNVVIATHDTPLVDSLRTRVIHIDNGRLQRDSTGTYHQEFTPTQKTTAEKHDLFDGREEDATSGEKVRITPTS